MLAREEREAKGESERPEMGTFSVNKECQDTIKDIMIDAEKSYMYKGSFDQGEGRGKRKREKREEEKRERRRGR